MEFRSALNGFNRSDVVTYLQNLMEKHKAALLDAQAKSSIAAEEAARLRAENEALRTQLASLQTQVKEEEKAEPSMQQEELEAYRRAVAMEKAAAEKLAAAEKDYAEKLAAAEREAAEKTAKAKETLAQIQEKVNAMTAFLAEASSSLEEL